VIDLRSDTVTRPGAAMRRAMAEAAVGDDVYGEDPTVNRLEEVVADLLGTEKALFVPSGCMANQIAIQAHTRPGDDVLVGRGAHSFLYESGAASAYGGVQLTVLDGDGRFTAEQVEAAWKPDNHHMPPTRLVMVENTHNMGGGLLWAREALSAVQATGRRLGLALHLDGARLWNAAVASATTVAERARYATTVTCCVSKGLGAPVGSLLAGPADLVRQARAERKRLGGGLRQVGILAAAGLLALDRVERLVDDHARARALAEAAATRWPGSVDVALVQTNIVRIETADPRALLGHLHALGVLAVPASATTVRLVTHVDVDDDDIGRAVEALRSAP
jgi:threonine aldolase